PDGRRIASAAALPSYFRHATAQERDAYARTVVLWDAATGERARELLVPRGPVSELAFSPDGNRLAAACASGIVLFEAETGKALRQLGDGGWTRHLRFSADGNLLLFCGQDRAVASWDTGTGKRLRRWGPPAGPSEWVKPRERAFDGVPSPDGKVIAWRLW